MTERSVQSRVFVSPFQSYERGETWQKNHTNRLFWHKTSSEVQNSYVPCSIQVLSSHVTLSMKSVQGVGSLLLNWLKSLEKSLLLKRIQFLCNNCTGGFRVSRMLKS